MPDKKTVHSEIQCSRNLSAVDDILYVIGGKWKLRVIVAILNGHVRFNDLQRTIKGISARVLSNELKALEQNGLITRVVHPNQRSAMVEYVPTEYSKSLQEVIAPLVHWGEKHRRKIMSGN